MLGSYIRTQLTLALMLGVLVAIGMALLGVPYALLLAVLATVLGLVPMFGSALSAIQRQIDRLALCRPFQHSIANATSSRFDATELMAGVTEVLCYGTAVIVEEAHEPA